jgi:hypothetical protein
LKIEKKFSLSKPATPTKKEFKRIYKIIFIFFRVRADALLRPGGRGFYQVGGR